MFCFVTKYVREEAKAVNVYLVILELFSLCEQILECVFCMFLHSYKQTHTALSV